MKLIRIQASSRNLRESVDHLTSADWNSLSRAEKDNFLDDVNLSLVTDMNDAASEEIAATDDFLRKVHIDLEDDNLDDLVFDGDVNGYDCTLVPDMGFWSDAGSVPRVSGSGTFPSRLRDEWDQRFRRDMERALKDPDRRDERVRKVVSDMESAFEGIIDDIVDYYQSGDFMADVLDGDEDWYTDEFSAWLEDWG